MKANLLAASILVIVSANFAYAADAIVDEVVVVDTTFNWSGVYVGGQLGYSFNGSADYVYDDDSDDSSYDYQHDVDGALAGAYLGYNYQFSNGVVLGAEVDAAWTDIKGSGATDDSDPYSSRTEVDWTGAARLRLGYAFDRFLPYISGGVAVAGLSFTEFNDDDFYSGDDYTAVGWTLGAGAEWAITDNWVLRGEYRYTKFDGEDFTTQPEDETYEIDLDTHDVRIGLAYKF